MNIIDKVQNLNSILNTKKKGIVVIKKKVKKKNQQVINNSLEAISQIKAQQNLNELQFKKSLERYLTKAFLKCNNKNERKQMRKAVLQEIQNAKLLGNIQNRDWDNQNVPQLIKNTTEQKLFDDKNGITIQHSEQYLQQVDNIVKQIKQEILNNILDNNNQNEKKINQEQSNNNDLLQGQQKNNSLLNIQTATNANKKLLQFPSQKKPVEIQKKINLDQSNNSLLQHQQKNNTSLNIQTAVNTNKKSLSSIIQKKPVEVQQIKNNNEFDEDDFDVNKMKIQITGTCTKLEKEYLRLTSVPKAHEVRNADTLKKSFEFIKKMYINKQKDYQYFQSQFRSIRQDLLVQNIKNNFTIKVLEQNARICLENYDIQEYSRCLSQLIWIYRELIDLSHTAYKEFTYYRLIQNIFEDKKDNLLACLQEINNDQLLQSKEFEKAMKFQFEISIGNVKGFFNLYNSTKDLGKYLMDLQINKWKIWGLKIICKTYGPQTININIIQNIFGFKSTEQTIQELKQLNCILDDENEKILVKDSMIQLEQQSI